MKFRGAIVVAAICLVVPAEAVAQGGGITWSVRDNSAGPDEISGALEPSVEPAAGTPQCGALEPAFPVTGDISVVDGTVSNDEAFGTGNVPAFGGAPFAFDAESGPLGESPLGTFDLGFPTGRPSTGVITCLQVVGNVAYMGGRRISWGDLPGNISARGTVVGSAGPTTFSAANDCVASLSTRPFIVEWPGQRFTKTTVTDSGCVDSPFTPPAPAGFNTQVGRATGTLLGGAPATVEWKFEDGGPGSSPSDTVAIVVRDAGGSSILTVVEQTPAPFGGTPGGVWTFAP